MYLCYNKEKTCINNNSCEPDNSGDRETYRWLSYCYINTDSSLKIFFYLDKTTDAFAQKTLTFIRQGPRRIFSWLLPAGGA